MTHDDADFAGANATLMMSHELKDVALRFAAMTGGDASSALFGAACKVLDDQFGKGAWAPLAQQWLKTIIDAEREPTAYN